MNRNVLNIHRNMKSKYKQKYGILVIDNGYLCNSYIMYTEKDVE